MKSSRIKWILGIGMAMLVTCVTHYYARHLHDAYLSTSLVKAIKAKNVDETARLLQQGANPNTRSAREEVSFNLRDYFFSLLKSYPQEKSDTRSVLLEAVGRNEPKAVRLLLDYGADVDPSAVHYSSQLDSAAILRMFLAKGVQVNLANQEGTTLLMAAANVSSIECVDVLIQQGAKVNAQEKSGFTALIYAVSSGCEKNVRTLLAHGADPHIGEKGGTYDLTALRVAQESGSPTMIALVKEVTHGKRVVPANDHARRARRLPASR